MTLDTLHSISCVSACLFICGRESIIFNRLFKGYKEKSRTSVYREGQRWREICRTEAVKPAVEEQEPTREPEDRVNHEEVVLEGWYYRVQCRVQESRE